ncbi:Filament-like plant protein 3 [Forsythia ovata]|uniref:Filament-like plant protein 3 n=1 Tax=Forsythia ovata TaxID=205694 RepID=A0ABD1U4S9_9LAMI
MEKRKWLWKKRSSEKSPGESESSGSISSHSERYSDEQQDALKDSPNHNTQSPEVTSKAAIADDEVEKNHAKVAEEAVAGWERAENEVIALKQQLEAAIQQNLNLEVRSSHLDGALKECVRQLRQARETMAEKTSEWESAKSELENQIIELRTRAEAAKTEHSASIDTNTLLKLKAVEKENSSLKQELVSQSKELEIRIIERDLSTRAAETASKLQLESIKKVAKLEAECRRLQALARKSPSFNDQKSIMASSFYVESLTDSQSDSGERLSALEVDTRKMNNVEVELNGHEKSCSDSWALALIAELDQFKNEKSTPKSLAACSVEIDMMDDFLEMERLAALPELKNGISRC